VYIIIICDNSHKLFVYQFSTMPFHHRILLIIMMMIAADDSDEDEDNTRHQYYRELSPVLWQ